MLTPPLLPSVKIDWPDVMVTTLLAPMVAVSLLPGTALHDQSLAVLQLPVAGFQVQLAAVAYVGTPSKARTNGTAESECLKD